MRLDVLNKKDEKVVAKLLDLYETSFPASERRDRTKLTDMIGTNDFMRFCAIIDNHDQLAGLFIYWDFPQFVYGEHFAIFPEMRNHGVGRDLLGHLFAITDKPIYIEVEPAEDEMSVRRVEFYRRNGFETVTKESKCTTTTTEHGDETHIQSLYPRVEAHFHNLDLLT